MNSNSKIVFVIIYLSSYRPKANGELLLLLKLNVAGTVAWSNLKPEKKKKIRRLKIHTQNVTHSKLY
jgi:hypothetical protein